MATSTVNSYTPPAPATPNGGGDATAGNIATTAQGFSDGMAMQDAEAAMGRAMDADNMKLKMQKKGYDNAKELI